MYSIACGDVLPGCPVELRADTVEALLASVAEHAHDEHGVTEMPDEVVEQVRDAIRDDPTSGASPAG